MFLDNKKKIVIKLGSSTIVDGKGKFKKKWLLSLIKDIKKYDEILLIGSGKGVTSVKRIKEIKWKRKNLRKFRFLLRHYNNVINKCNPYRF